MKHSGKARKAAFKMILVTLVLVVVVLVIAFLATIVASILSVLLLILIPIWLVFAVFTLYFFRDPTPSVPVGKNLVISPAFAKVDIIDTIVEPEFMGGECRRVSMFLSVLDVHVQFSPVGGSVTHYKYTEGEFMNAMRTECGNANENAYLGFVAAEPQGVKIGVRLIAGVLARRIVPWVAVGDSVERGERISLIQFGSRCDVYLPPSAKIQVKLGDKLVGGESVIASFD